MNQTRLWFSELRPHGSGRSHRRLPLHVSSAVLPIVFPPSVRGGGGRLVRRDDRRRRLGLKNTHQHDETSKYFC